MKRGVAAALTAPALERATAQKQEEPPLVLLVTPRRPESEDGGAVAGDERRGQSGAVLIRDRTHVSSSADCKIPCLRRNMKNVATRTG